MFFLVLSYIDTCGWTKRTYMTDGYIDSQVRERTDRIDGLDRIDRIDSRQDRQDSRIVVQSHVFKG